MTNPLPKTTALKAEELIDEVIGAWAELAGIVWGIEAYHSCWGSDMTYFNNASVELRDKTIEILRKKIDQAIAQREDRIIKNVEECIKCPHCRLGSQDSMSGASECIHCGGTGHILFENENNHILDILQSIKSDK